jgi:LCP family protein required for cell wall assembly
LLGRRRRGFIFLTPALLLVLAALILYGAGGATPFLVLAVTPGVLTGLGVVNGLLALYRVATVIDLVRPFVAGPAPVAATLLGMVLLIGVPQGVLGSTLRALDTLLNETFASVDATAEPSLPTEPILGPSIAPSPAASPDRSVEPYERSSGTGDLPSLSASFPWERTAANAPWGSDGRFSLLLLGSDAGPDRWSRRMDIMILVEVDVATGKTSMIGLPRNLVNVPLPPGAARDATPCKCFNYLLNEMYAEATSRHPSRWPGTGATSGIGAVRATISHLTGRPIDAVLVSDLWGVIKVVDAMGGVDITVPARVYDRNYSDPVRGSIVLDIRSGAQHFDGRMALAYARSRHQDSDYGRMARQQTLLLAIRDQLSPLSILTAPALVDAARGLVWTDISRESLPALVEIFSRAKSATVKQLRIVPSKYPAYLTPAWVTRIQADIAKLLGTVPPPPDDYIGATPSPSESPTPSPSESPTPSPSESPTPSPGLDTDSDGVVDALDNCSAVPNVDQLDSNSNGIGDVCEPPPSP